jgi:hypothetical protein
MARLGDTLASSSDNGLKEEAERDRAQAAGLPPGSERDALIRKARRTDTAAHIGEWASSPGLRSPD